MDYFIVAAVVFVISFIFVLPRNKMNSATAGKQSASSTVSNRMGQLSRKVVKAGEGNNIGGKDETQRINKKKKSPNQVVNLSRKMAGTNWQAAALNNSQVQLKAGNVPSSSGTARNNSNTTTEKAPKKKHKEKKLTKFVAMDCEMVGTGPNGQDAMLARVSIVNQNGDVLLDRYVKPREPVTDYRTQVSGIRPKDIENGEDFDKVQDEVVNILNDRILVGHSVHNDLAVLYINHPYKFIRDTAKYGPLARLVSNGATPSLKRLCKAILGVDIQTGEHSSVEDARAVMSIYNRVSVDWEKHLKRYFHQQQRHNHHAHKSRN